MSLTYTLGTRGSKLARIQTEIARKQITNAAPEINISVVTHETDGDRFADRSIHELPGKGFFTKDLDQAVVSGEIDAAVHSAKDVPTDSVTGLRIGAYLKRQSPLDVLVARPPVSDLKSLPDGATIGTSSLRRQALLLNRRPDLNVEPIRGNVDTRLEKLFDRREVDALVLARAGLERLDRSDTVTQNLDPETFHPAPGQGAILIQCREEETPLTNALTRVNDDTTMVQIRMERAIIDELNGGCRIPLGAYCYRTENNSFRAQGMVGSLDGSTLLTASSAVDRNDLRKSAKTIATNLKEQGARSLIQEARSYLQKQVEE